MSSRFSDSLFHALSLMETYEETVTAFGSGAISQLGGYVMLNQYQTVMLVMGGASSRASGAFNSIMHVEGFGRLDINLPHFDDVPPEPDTDCVRAITAEIAKEKPDAVLAIGGGSVMDAAKAAYLSWQTGMDVDQLFGKDIASAKFPGRQFSRILAIPTTSGTGAEVTCYSNIIDKKTGVKKLIQDSAIVPAFAAVDPEYTLSAPVPLTRATGFDALVHAIESFLNFRTEKQFPEAKKRALSAIELIVTALPEVLAAPHDFAMRARMSAAATLGGMAIRQSPTSLPHLLSFSFCGKSTHGEAVAALLPHFWRYYLEVPEVREFTMRLANFFPGKTPENVIASYEKFIKKCGGTVSPGKLTGEPDSMIAKLAADASQNPVKLESAPRKIAASDCAEIFNKILKPVW